MCRTIAITKNAPTSRATAMLFCLLAAVPLLVPHGRHQPHTAPGARTAFQLLGSSPSREVKIAVRSHVAVVTVPFTQR